MGLTAADVIGNERTSKGSSLAEKIRNEVYTEAVTQHGRFFEDPFIRL